MTPGTFDLELYRGTTFGPYEITCKGADGEPVDLTGWSAFAQVRAAIGKSVVLDLEPSIPTGVDGKIVFGKTYEQTVVIPVCGDFIWDLVLEKPTGEIIGPVLAGNFVIRTVVTRP